MKKVPVIFPKKRYGQHFLHSPIKAKKMVSALSPSIEDKVIEIGPGKGIITFELANRVKQVLCCEIDIHLVDYLNNTIKEKAFSNIIILHQDFLKFNMNDINKYLGPPPYKVIGNLPFNISTAILARLWENVKIVDTAVLTFQKEVAERILATPGSKNYGRLTLLVNLYSTVKKIDTLKASHFFPTPEVDATVLLFKFFQDSILKGKEKESFYRIIDIGFQHRRKTLWHTLNKYLIKKENLSCDIKEILTEVNIGSKVRPEEISLEKFISLARIMAQYIE